jgi:hypothetical protein
MPCPLCIPWNQPLVVNQRFTIDAGPVALRYQEWLWYHLHVLQHQAGNWAGDIDKT